MTDTKDPMLLLLVLNRSDIGTASEWNMSTQKAEVQWCSGYHTCLTVETSSAVNYTSGPRFDPGLNQVKLFGFFLLFIVMNR